MSSRFEKIIATAVVAGALALTGCSSEEEEVLPFPNQTSTTGGEPQPGGGGGGPPLMLLGARTIGVSQIELQYSEPMQVGNPISAGNMFTLNRNNVAYALNFSVANITSYSPALPWKPVNTTSYLSYNSAGIAAGGVYSAAVSASDNQRIILTLNGGLIESDDGATGMLRLSFTNGADGVEDQAGNPAPNLNPPPNNIRGNVDDGSNAPGLIDARTINPNAVELTFSEPLMVVRISLRCCGVI